jgi:type I restriction enzyme S subunit
VNAILGDICEVITDGTHASPERVESGIPVLSAQNVKTSGLDMTTSRFTSDRELAAFERRFRPRRGDVLMTIVGTIGRVTVLEDEPRAVFQRSVAFLRPRPDLLDSRYLALTSQSPQFKSQLARATNQSSQAGVYLSKLKAIQVPLPPLVEQRRIAAILDHADALRAKRRQVLTHLDSLTRAIFKDIVGGDYWRSVSASARGSNEAGWPWVPLTDISRLATGHTPDRKRPDYWDGGRIPWISLPEIRSLDGQTAWRTGLAITEAGLANSSAVLLPVGTVCFSRTASVGFVTKLGVAMATSQDFHNWVPGPDLDSDYLMAALRYSRRHLLSVSDGSIHRTIYQRTAQTFRVLLPPLNIQHEFAEQAAAVDAQRDAASRALVTYDELCTSLQSRAFRGGL